MSSIREHRFAVVLIGASLCWGLATVISKRAVEEIAPLQLLPIQLAVSVLALGLVLLLRQDRSPRPTGLGRLAALGVLNPGISYALGLLGLVHLTASLSVLLWAVEPALILLAARVLLDEPLHPAVGIGTATALTGVGLVVFQAGATGSPVGVALTLAAVTACALYTVACRRLLLQDTALVVVVVQQACALAFAVVLLVVVRGLGLLDVLGGGTDLRAVSTTAWAAAALSGVLYYGLAFWLYLTGLHRVPAAMAGLFLTLIPVFGVAGGRLLLDERLTSRQWIGAGVVVGSIALVAVLTSRPAPSSRPVVPDPR